MKGNFFLVFFTYDKLKRGEKVTPEGFWKIKPCFCQIRVDGTTPNGASISLNNPHLQGSAVQRCKIKLPLVEGGVPQSRGGWGGSQHMFRALSAELSGGERAR